MQSFSWPTEDILIYYIIFSLLSLNEFCSATDSKMIQVNSLTAPLQQKWNFSSENWLNLIESWVISIHFASDCTIHLQPGS